MSVPVPQPPGLPLLGNVADIDPNNGVLSLFHLSEKYGTSVLAVLASTTFNRYRRDLQA